MAKQTADENNHVCVTKTTIIKELDNPTTKGRSKIQEAIDRCTKCKDLVIQLKENR